MTGISNGRTTPMLTTKDLVETLITRKRIAILFLCTTLVVLLSYGYNFINIERAQDKWRLSVGSKYVITVLSKDGHNIKPVRAAVVSNVTTLRSQNYSFHEEETIIRILLWSEVYRRNWSFLLNEEDHFISYGKPKHKCPLKYRFYSDRNETRNYSAVIVHAAEPDDLPIKLHSIPWILEYDQTPLVYTKLSDTKFMQLFTYSLGYRRDSDFFNPKIRKPKTRHLFLPLDQSYDYAASIHSNCETIRTGYLKELLKYFRIWFFGDCLRNVARSTIVRRNETGYRESKLNLTKLFKFTLAFMSQDCDDYIDEQLSDAWDAASVPIFMGTESIDEIVPEYLKHSYIKVSDFKTPRDLGAYLNNLVSDHKNYVKMRQWSSDEMLGNENIPLLQVWYPTYSLGCQIAMKVIKTKIPNLRYLQPFTCTPRTLNQWFGINQSNAINVTSLTYKNIK